MNIVTCINDSRTTIDYLAILNKKIEELLSPIVFETSCKSYSEFISNLGTYIHSKARDIIKRTLEKMDDYFFNLKDRKRRYYSKGYRKREIITVFGHIIYYRHEYVDRITGKPSIYVDEKIGLHRKDRYDHTVCSLIVNISFLLNNLSSIVVSEDIAIKFYKNIRCGILHSAQTKDGSTLCYKSNDAIEYRNNHNSINVNVCKFSDEMLIYFNNYISRLNSGDLNTRKNFIKKMNYIFL